MRLTPIAFERLVLDLMARMGYGTFENAATMTAATGDEGIDGIIMQDKLGFDLIYVQAKRWGAGAYRGPAGGAGIRGRNSRTQRQGPVRDHVALHPGRRRNMRAHGMWC